ncbi:MAG: GNAT family N-acetyltransferase [Janthinobacterium lividum]
MIRASWPTLTQNLLVLDSREAILDLAPLLESLAERCDQAGAMHWLPYFLDQAVMGRRAPFLVLVLRPEQDEGRSLCVEDVEAAALYFEYRLFGMRTGAVATGDAVGFSSVIAPEQQRTLVAAITARALVERGASVVLATYAGDEEPESRPLLTGWSGVLSAARKRQVGRSLRLLPTMQGTLAQMGKRTRTNLRYYRRRLEESMPCEYVVDAAAELATADVQELNAGSLNPVSPAEFERRIRSASELPGSFLSGLRAADGQWLSLMGGWRQGTTTVLYWQMNSAGYEKQSIGTVMRSFFLEHEIGRGAKKLLMYGGTSHAMRHAFEQDTVADLVIRRKGLQSKLLCWASRFFATPEGISGRGNFLANTLQDQQLRWSANISPQRMRKPMLTKLARSRVA